MLEESEVRHLAIELLKAETARDKQKRVGASNLSNGCDFCLASDLLGIDRSTPFADRPWGGRVIGTAIHGLLESRFGAVLGDRYPDAQVEQKFIIGTLGSYGEVGSSADLFIPSERHLFDYKSTENAKISVILDAWAKMNDEPVRFGRQHSSHKAKTLSEAAYAKEIEKAVYKLETYARQLALYGRGKALSGYAVDALSIVFISRDATMYYDNPAQPGYVDESKLWGVNTITFPYDDDFADQVWERALWTWKILEAGGDLERFKRHPLCFRCSTEGAEVQPLNNPVTLGSQAA